MTAFVIRQSKGGKGRATARRLDRRGWRTTAESDASALWGRGEPVGSTIQLDVFSLRRAAWPSISNVRIEIER